MNYQIMIRTNNIRGTMEFHDLRETVAMWRFLEDKNIKVDVFVVSRKFKLVHNLEELINLENTD